MSIVTASRRQMMVRGTSLVLLALLGSCGLSDLASRSPQEGFEQATGADADTKADLAAARLLVLKQIEADPGVRKVFLDLGDGQVVPEGAVSVPFSLAKSTDRLVTREVVVGEGGEFVIQASAKASAITYQIDQEASIKTLE
ncbi:hypothetical protein [Actinomyces trachealis]|uniref:hypothetical protein n=1 Tax=Actinomyces trachealis TaxID=2763540 RepID=UPI001892B452|nr:hypothetical protein [Actinomyces trachealis]